MVNSDSCAIAAFVIDEAGHIKSWSNECEQLLGHSVAQVLRQPIDILIAGKNDTSPSRHPPAISCVVLAQRLRHRDGSHIRATLSLLQQPGLAGGDRIALISLSPANNPNSHLEKLVNNLPGPIYLIDASGRFLLWNKTLTDVLGKSPQQLLQSSAPEFFGEPDRARIRAKMEETLSVGRSVVEAMLITKGGIKVPYLFTHSRMMIKRKLCICGMGVEIAERKNYEEELHLRERAIQASHSGVLITRCAGRDNIIEYVNPAFERITGYSKEEVLGRDPRFMRAQDMDRQQVEKIHTALKTRTGVHVILRNLRKNGDIFWNDLKIDPVANAEGQVTHFVGVITDVTEAKQSESHLAYMASHDVLTGLANRTLMREHLELAIHHAHRHGALVALVFVDLDKFKQINDKLGHDAGDEVLKAVAARLRANVRDSDIVARLGGDEFVLVLANQPNLESITDLVDRLHRSVAEAMPFISDDLMPTISAGISVYPHDGERVETLMRNADAAMYHAKSLGRNNYQFYSNKLHAAAQFRLQQETSLRAAIEQGQLFLLYQPKIDSHSGSIIGAEALVRWQHPEQGILTPSSFLPLAEETGLILQISEWVLAQVCHALQQFQSAGLSEFTISINLSARQLKHKGLVDDIAARLRRASLSPSSLELELTENQLMENPAYAFEVLKHLKSLGLRLSIDDFGSGFSSLSYLEKLPIDHVKIDTAFVHSIGRQEKDAAIVKAVIALSHCLGIRVVAEGVETEGQCRFLQRYDCDEMQGYYFSEPLIARPLLNLIRKSALPCR